MRRGEREKESQRKVQPSKSKEEKVEKEEEEEELLLFKNGKELLPGDILTSLEYLGYDKVSPELYQIVNNLEKQVTGKMNLQNLFHAVNETGPKPNEFEIKKVYETFVLDPKKKGINDEDLIRIAPVVDEDPEQDFKDYLKKIANDGENLTLEEVEDIMLKDMTQYED